MIRTLTAPDLPALGRLAAASPADDAGGVPALAADPRRALTRRDARVRRGRRRPAGGLGHRGGDGRRDPRVQRRRHDRVRRAASSATTSAIASAAATFMPSVIRVARGVQRAAEHARERQHVVDLVGEVAAAGGDHARRAGAATSGCTSGVGLASAKIDRRPAPSPATAASGIVPPETPISTSAPRSASVMPPARRSALVSAASSRLGRRRGRPGPAWMMPRESTDDHLGRGRRRRRRASSSPRPRPRRRR